MQATKDEKETTTPTTATAATATTTITITTQTLVNWCAGYAVFIFVVRF